MPRLGRIGWLLVAALVGCAASPNERFDTSGLRAIGPEKAVNGPDVFRGDSVLWGGRIARVDRRHGATEIEILRYPLNESQRPDADAEPGRRFIARHPGALEKERYARERWVSVKGTLAGTRDGNIGDHPYTYPLVRVSDHELWPRPAPLHGYRERPRIRFGIGIEIGID